MATQTRRPHTPTLSLAPRASFVRQPPMEARTLDMSSVDLRSQYLGDNTSLSMLKDGGY